MPAQQLRAGARPSRFPKHLLRSAPGKEPRARTAAFLHDATPTPAKYERKARHREAVKRSKRRRLVDSGHAVDLDPASLHFDQELVSAIGAAKGARTLAKIFSQYAVHMSPDALVAMLAAFAKIARAARPRPSAEQLAALALPASQVVQVLLPQVGSLSPQQLGAASEAVGHLRLYSLPLLTALCSHAASLLHPAPPASLAAPRLIPSGPTSSSSSGAPARHGNSMSHTAPASGAALSPASEATLSPASGAALSPAAAAAPGVPSGSRRHPIAPSQPPTTPGSPTTGRHPTTHHPRQRRPQFSAEALASLLHGLGVHRHQPPALLRRHLQEAALQLLPKMEAQHLAKAVYAMAVLEWQLPSSWLDAAMAVFRGHFNSRGCHAASVTKFLIAMVLLGARPDANWLMACSAEARRKLDYQGPAEMVAVLWAFARLGSAAGGFVPDGVYMECWLSALARKLQRLDAQGVVAAVEVLAAMGWGTRLRVDWVPGKFRAAVLERAAELMGEMKRKQLVGLGWGLVEVRVLPEVQWIRQWAAAVDAEIAHLSAGECADVVYVAAQWGSQWEFDEAFWEALVARVGEMEGLMLPRDLVKAAYSLRKAGYSSAALQHGLRNLVVDAALPRAGQQLLLAQLVE